MGHGDEIAIVDANFPSATVGRRVVALPAPTRPRALDAILTVFPLDTVDRARGVHDGGRRRPQTPYRRRSPRSRRCSRRTGSATCRWAALDRHAFYERARNAFAVVRTGELRQVRQRAAGEGRRERVSGTARVRWSSSSAPSTSTSSRACRASPRPARRWRARRSPPRPAARARTRRSRRATRAPTSRCSVRSGRDAFADAALVESGRGRRRH